MVTILCRLLIFGIAVTAPLSAAGPLTHVYLAERWIELNEEYTDEEHRACLLGTLFPDIRYLGVISRDATHEKAITTEAIAATDDPFLKGMRIHAFVDEVREQFAEQWGAFKLLDDAPQQHRTTLLKVVEDEILHSRSHWGYVLAYLTTIVDGEVESGISEAAIAKWHRILSIYFGREPSLLIHQMALLGLGYFNVPADVVKAWSIGLPKLVVSDRSIEYVDALVDHFERKFQEGRETHG